MRVLVVSDTHGPRRWRALPDVLVPALEAADVILHAGDVCQPFVLDELAAFAPVHVVMGNNDGPDVQAWGAQPTLELDLAGVRVAMVHIAGPKDGRAARMRRLFPDADLVVFGHSHQPVDDATGAVHLFNPGSVTDPRREPTGSYGELEIAAGRLVTSRIVPVPRPVPQRRRPTRQTSPRG